MELERISFRGKKKLYYVEKNFKPRFNEIDSYEVLWNGHFINYFELIRMNFFDEFGLNVTKFKEEGILFPVHMFHVEVLRAIRAGEAFDLAIRPFEFGNGFMEFLHLALKDGKVVAFGKVRHFAVNEKDFKVFFDVPEPVKIRMKNILYKFEMLKPGDENANTNA